MPARLLIAEEEVLFKNISDNIKIRKMSLLDAVRHECDPSTTIDFLENGFEITYKGERFQLSVKKVKIRKSKTKK